MRAGGAVRAVVFQLAMGAGAALRKIAFHLPMRTRGAHRAMLFEHAVMALDFLPHHVPSAITSSRTFARDGLFVRAPGSVRIRGRRFVFQCVFSPRGRDQNSETSRSLFELIFLSPATLGHSSTRVIDSTDQDVAWQRRGL